MTKTTTTVGAIDDLRTISEALRWIRKFATDGIAEHNLHAIEQDSLMDLTLRLEEMRDRTGKTGVLQRAGEDEIEMIRRRA